MKQWEFDERWKQGMKDLAEEEERACGDWENEEGLSEHTKEQLFSRIRAEERKSGNAGMIRIRKRYLAVLAAAFALVFGMGVVGSREWRSESNDLERESGVITKVDNERKEDVLLEEEELYREIEEKLGIAAIRMRYMPDGMVLDGTNIRENLGWAVLYYLYDENVISVKMSKQSIEVSADVQWDGEYRKLDVAAPTYYVCRIDAYCMDEREHYYGANILYGNGYYVISGKFGDENEFLRILEKIYFKNL